MKLVLFPLLLGLSSCSLPSETSDEWEVIDGEVNLVMFLERKQLPIIFSGETAKKLYESILADPSYDHCLGGEYKTFGNMLCYVLATGEYYCELAIDLVREKLMDREYEFCL